MNTYRASPVWVSPDPLTDVPGLKVPDFDPLKFDVGGHRVLVGIGESAKCWLLFTPLYETFSVQVVAPVVSRCVTIQRSQLRQRPGVPSAHGRS